MIRIVALGLALAAGDAFAHAALVASEPADGAVLERAPAAIVLRFSEPVSPVAIRLLDRSGTAASLVAATEGDTVQAALPAGLPHGAYLLSYRVTSLDAHPIGGAVAFSIGSAERLQMPHELDAVGAGAPLRGALRVFHDLALLIAAGGALFALAVRPFPGQRVVLAIAAAVAGASAMAAAGLHGAALLDASVWDGSSWRVGFATTRGTAAIAVGTGAAALLAGALRPGGRTTNALLGTGALLSLASFALTGHAAAAEPRALAATIVLSHVLGAAFWAGSLVGLLAILRRASGPEAATALSRFSGLGVLAVLALMTAGVAFAALQLDSLAQLVESGYGRWIVVKAALLAGLLALAARNRLRLLPALERGEAHAAHRLRGTVTAEIVLMAGAIAAAAMLAQTPPPRATLVELVQGEYSARLEVTPARAGTNVVTVSFRTAGTAFDPAEVVLEFENPASGVEPILRKARRSAPGEYRVEGTELAHAGDWSIAIHARLTDFDKLVLRTRLRVR